MKLRDLAALGVAGAIVADAIWPRHPDAGVFAGVARAWASTLAATVPPAPPPAPPPPSPRAQFVASIANLPAADRDWLLRAWDAANDGLGSGLP